MASQKNAGLTQCSKCTKPLSEENWNAYDQRVGHYICKKCRKLDDKRRQDADPKYNQKQRMRHRGRRSVVIHSYGDSCLQCGQDEYYKLTIFPTYGTTDNLFEHLYNHAINKDGYQVLCYNCTSVRTVVYADKYALRDKIKVVSNYGKECCKCKEGRIETLTIGPTEKYTVKGVKLYRQIIKDNYPEGIDIICYNCNNAQINEQKDYCLTGVNEKNASLLDGSISEASLPISRMPKLL